jgi:hypothetical protein
MARTSWKKLGQMAVAVTASLLCTSDCRTPNVFGTFGETKDRIAENEIRSMVEQVQLYRETRSRLPSELSDLTKANLLKNAQEDGTVLDPWKRPYIYLLVLSSKEGFVIFSKGADENTEEDDIRSDRLRVK